MRAFAFAELVCQPVSILTVLGGVVFACLRHTGVWTTPDFVSEWAAPVLLSAAVGYLTNWIAITMLFEPYEPTWRHWLPWCTLGAWRQGLLPKNKSRIAAVLADQVATRLLQPEKLANDLCGMIGGALEDPSVLAAVETMVQIQLGEHDSEIIEYLTPRIESAIVKEIDTLLTPDRIRDFWNSEILPRLADEETRNEVADLVLRALTKRAPEIAEKAKPWLVGTIRAYVEKEIRDTWLGDMPFVGDRLTVWAADLSEGMADSLLDERKLEGVLRDWVRRPETAVAVGEELAGFVDSFREWLSTEEGTRRIGGFTGEIRERFKAYLGEYLRNNLAATATRFMHSDEVRQWVKRILPTMRPSVEKMIREIGTPTIIEKIDVAGRVKTAVDKMDMAEFHGMLSTIMAEHLGAIQVLGYLLGAIAGLLLIAI